MTHSCSEDEHGYPLDTCEPVTVAGLESYVKFDAAFEYNCVATLHSGHSDSDVPCSFMNGMNHNVDAE
ncbi:hypothetical protein KIPB_013780, partial [Kipferlia bialata]|eukprot:g13780.t1